MQARLIAPFVAATSALLVCFASPPVEAAEFTDLLDAADDLEGEGPENYDPWDFNIEPSFNFDYSTAQITRERPCVPSDDPSLDRTIENDEGDTVRNSGYHPRAVPDCEQGARVETRREMLYRGTRSTLDLDLRAGLFKDLELKINVPYVISSTRGLKYDNEPRRGQNIVDQGNSSVDPSDQRIRSNAEHVFDSDTDYRAPENAGAYTSALDQYQMYRFFELDDEYSSYDRSGIGDPSVGLHWAPWNDDRDDTKSTMVLGFDYVMPIAPQQRHDNSAVGEGVHELQWNVAASKRFDWIEPYFGARYKLPIAATNSLYGRIDTGPDDRGAGQVLTNPPHEGKFTIGTEFIPYEDPEVGARYGIDLRFEFGYTSEGRDYTPMFDHMTSPDNECNDRTIDSVQPSFDNQGNLTNPEDVACAWVLQQPTNSDPPSYDLESAVANNPDRQFGFTDLMSVDDYGTFSGQIGAYLQPTKYFQFRGNIGLTHHQSHLLSTARTGSNTGRTDSSSVDMTAEYERNPAYNSAYDNSGDRFRIERYNTWHFNVTTAVQF